MSDNPYADSLANTRAGKQHKVFDENLEKIILSHQCAISALVVAVGSLSLWGLFYNSPFAAIWQIIAFASGTIAFIATTILAFRLNGFAHSLMLSACLVLPLLNIVAFVATINSANRRLQSSGYEVACFGGIKTPDERPPIEGMPVV